MTKGKSAKMLQWFNKQRKDVGRVFAPAVDYDADNDLLYIAWLPQLKCKFSLESDNGFIFDITEKGEEVKGVEIFDFKRRFLKDARTKTKKKKRR